MKKAFFFIIFFSVILSSCKDIFEENIEDKIIVVKTPLDNATSTLYNQLFWWEELEGATMYHLEIVSPSFDDMQEVILDTLTSSTKIQKALNPGIYEWRIRGENGSYKSNYQLYTLTIESSSLNNQNVIRIAPITNRFFKTSTVSFSWESLYGATKYLIQVDHANANYTSPILYDSTENLEFNFDLPEEGDYIWRVRAKNDAGEKTAWTSSWATGYYNTPPDAPTLKTPLNNSIESSTVYFSWHPVSNASSYSIYIYKDGGSVPEIITVNGTSYTKIFTGGTEFTWGVTCTDKAGNESDISTERDFEIE
jgi:uncharacterized protein (DUF2249 family)